MPIDYLLTILNIYIFFKLFMHYIIFTPSFTVYTTLNVITNQSIVWLNLLDVFT